MVILSARDGVGILKDPLTSLLKLVRPLYMYTVVHTDRCEEEIKLSRSSLDMVVELQGLEYSNDS